MIIRHRLTLFLGLAIGAAIATISDTGITQSPSISGRVLDAAGYPVPGVFVTTSAETATPRRVTTERDGTYQFATLPDGRYRIDFELLGFDRMRRNHVRVRAGGTATVEDVTLYVSSLCECVNVQSATTLGERPGLVTDESGQPLGNARLQIVSPARTGVAYTDGEGRFRVRAPVNESWPLTASASGFIAVTQQVSGGFEEPVVFKLRRSGTPLPDIERFYRVCCPSDLFTSDGR
jgi:hypothetical protein